MSLLAGVLVLETMWHLQLPTARCFLWVLQQVLLLLPVLLSVTVLGKGHAAV